MATQDKKELLRCVIERVFLESRGKVIRARGGWYGGGGSEREVPKSLFSAPPLYHRVCELARCHTEAEIAQQLNEAGLRTVKGRPWTARWVMDFRLSNAIPWGFTTTAALRIPQTGYLTRAEVAKQWGVSQSTVQKWYRLGVLNGKHDGGPASLWIRWTEEGGERLGGGSTPEPRMVSVRRLCQTQGKDPDAILTWAEREGHTVYRLRRGSTLRFFVLPQPSSLPPQ